jgi:hypothetical protein
MSCAVDAVTVPEEVITTSSRILSDVECSFDEPTTSKSSMTASSDSIAEDEYLNG